MSKPRIFIVEDSPMQVLFLKSQLEGLGYEVVGSSASGEEAVDRIAETKPDLLLLDMHLAGSMAGSDVAERVNESGPIPHIYLTAYSSEETFSKTTATNPSGYILKPFTVPALDFQIRLALNNAEARRLVEERSRKLQALIEQSGDAILLTDSGGTVIEWNPKAEEILGFPRKEVLGLGIWEILFRLLREEERTEEARGRLRRKVTTAYKSRTIPKISALTDSVIYLPDGRRRVVQFAYFRIEVKDDFQICGVIRDITRQKEYEYEQETLYSILTVCNASGDPKLLVREFCRILLERFDFSGTAGFLNDDRGLRELVFSGGSLTEELLERSEVVLLFDELCRTEKQGEAGRFPGLEYFGKGFCTLSEFSEAAGLPQEIRTGTPRVVNLAPIRSGTEVLGLVVFCNGSEKADTERKVPLLELAAEQFALTLKRFHAERTLKRQNKLLTVRDLLSSKVGSTFDLHQVFDLALDIMSKNLNADGGMVHLFDERTRKLSLFRQIRAGEAVRPYLEEFSLDDSILGSSAALGSTIIVDDLSLERGKVPAEALESGWRSIICTPLKREKEFYGVLSLFSEKRGSFDKTTSDLMNSVVNPIVMAVENSFLYQKTARINEDLERRVQERTNNLEVLNKISQDLNYVMDYHELFSLLCSHLWSVTRFDVAVGVLRDEAGSEAFVSRVCAIDEKAENLLKAKIESAIWNLSGTVKPFPSIHLLEAEGVPNDPARTVTSLNSFYEAPFFHDKELIAYMILGAERKDAFTENRQLLSIVTNQSTVLLKRLRDLLSSEKTRLEQIVKTLPEGILLVDEEGRIVARNPVAEDLLKPLFGGSVPDVLTEFGGLSIDALVSRDETRQSGSAEISVGDDRVLSVTVVPIGEGPDEGGKILTIQDITEERKQDAQIKLRERLAAVGQLAAGIAHDFNNILTGIIGYSEYLQLRKDVTEPAKPYLRKIVEQSKRAGALIQQILDFSRKSFAEFHSLDLVPFCKEMAKLFVRLIPEDIRIEFETKEAFCTVRGDPVQIQQILTNLVVNSRDAMPRGGIVVLRLETLLLKEDEAPPLSGLAAGSWAHITVSDTGTGIPKDVLPRVFEPFFTTKEVGKGSGLGLSQVYGLVEQHNGFIGIESAAGKGTRVDIYIPAAAVAESETEEVVEVSLPVRSKGVILFVEDEDGVRDVTANVLKEVGFTVFAAADGKEGLETFKKHKDEIEIVVSDIVMPKMGGRELFREIMKLSPETPFVFITGHPFDKRSDFDELEKASAILRKPLEFATLIKEINEILSAANLPETDG